MNSGQKAFKTGLRLLVAGLLLSAVAGCGGGFNAGPLELPVHENPEYTGGRHEDGRLMTSAADDNEIQELKDRIDYTDSDNTDLAEAIVAIRAQNVDENGKAVANNPDGLQIQVELKNGYVSQDVLEFRVKLRNQGSGLMFPTTRSRTSKNFSITGICDDRDCSKLTAKIQQSSPKEGKSKARSGEAGAILRSREASVKASVAPDMATALKKSSRLQSVFQAFEKPKGAPLRTLEISWGKSTFELKLDGGGSSVCLSGLLLQTNDSDQDLTVGCAGSASTSGLTAALIGNNNFGSLLIRLSEGQASILISVTPPSSGRGGRIDEILPPPLPPAPSTPSKGGIRLPSDPNHPITRVWDKDRDRTEVNWAIRNWSEKQDERTKNFLARIQPNLPVITAALRSSRVPTEFLALTMIESRFFIDDGYPVEVNPASSAAGPWQFVVGTAKSIGLKVYPFQDGRKAHPCDERALIGPATAGAGRYLRLLLDEFPSDPKLAVMSYYWGQGNVGNTVNCMKDADCVKKRLGAEAHQRYTQIKGAGFDFWQVKTFNMAPKAATDYVVNFMGAQFVGRDPELYGVRPYNPAEVNGNRPAPNSCK